MSFLVAYNGQFSPHQMRVEGITIRVPSVVDVQPTSRVNEFREILQNQTDESIFHRPHAKVEAYEQHARSYQQQKKREHAKDIMTSPVKMIPETAPAIEARNVMEKYGFRHLPVVNSKNVIVGMISDRELLGDVANKSCAEIMIKKVIVSDEHTSINEIAIIFLNEKINALPILNRKHEVTGIITLTDILEYVIRCTAFLAAG